MNEHDFDASLEARKKQMKTSIKRGLLIAAPAALALVACASAGATPELVDARRAYERARASEAQRLAPDRLLSAKEALDSAERAHKDAPGSSKERSYAYVAGRRAQLAQEYGELSRLQNERQQAEQNYVTTQDRLRRAAERRAGAVRAYLVSRGVKSERVTADAKGEQNPIASNDTAEGRANKRRVEIVVQSSTTTSGQ